MKRFASQALAIAGRRSFTTNMQAVRASNGLLKKLQTAPVAQQVLAARYARLDPVSMSEIEVRFTQKNNPNLTEFLNHLKMVNNNRI